MNEIRFLVEEADDGSYRAKVVGTSIHTEADTLEELHREIRDAVHCHVDERAAPPLILWSGQGLAAATGRVLGSGGG